MGLSLFTTLLRKREQRIHIRAKRWESIHPDGKSGLAERSVRKYSRRREWTSPGLGAVSFGGKVELGTLRQDIAPRLTSKLNSSYSPHTRNPEGFVRVNPRSFLGTLARFSLSRGGLLSGFCGIGKHEMPKTLVPLGMSQLRTAFVPTGSPLRGSD